MTDNTLIAMRDLHLGKYFVNSGEEIPPGILLPEMAKAFIDLGYAKVA